MTLPVRWGLAGCGWIARDHVAPALSSLAAVLDPSADARDALVSTRALASGPHSVVNTGSRSDFFAAGLDAVYVAAPNDAHRPLVEACAAAGVPVLCEKPMATTLADARAMVGACAEAGVLYATAHNQRFHPAHVALRELVAGGALGEVRQARLHYACTAPPWWSAGDWHWDRARAGGGALFDLAPHGLDLLGVLLGADLAEVTALHQGAGPVEEGAVIAARYGGDVLATLHVSYACPETLPRRRLELIGTRGCALAQDTMGQTPGGSLRWRDAATSTFVPPEATNVTVAWQDVAFDAAGDPFVAQIAAFERAVRGEEPWPYPAGRDLAVMAALELLATPRPALRVPRPSELAPAAPWAGTASAPRAGSASAPWAGTASAPRAGSSSAPRAGSGPGGGRLVKARS